MCFAEGLPFGSAIHPRGYSVGCNPTFGADSATLATDDGVQDLHILSAALQSRKPLAQIQLTVLDGAAQQPAIGQIYGASGSEFDPQYCDNLSRVCDSA